MAGNSQGCQVPGERINGCEEKLNGYYAIYEAAQDFCAEDGMFFDKFGQVVEATCDREGEEGEA